MRHALLAFVFPCVLAVLAACAAADSSPSLDVRATPAAGNGTPTALEGRLTRGIGAALETRGAEVRSVTARPPAATVQIDVRDPESISDRDAFRILDVLQREGWRRDAAITFGAIRPGGTMDLVVFSVSAGGKSWVVKRYRGFAQSEDESARMRPAGSVELTREQVGLIAGGEEAVPEF